MGFLRVTLWLTAYTAGVVRLFAACMVFARSRTAENLKKILFLFAFGGIVVSLSNMELLFRLGTGSPLLAGNVGLFFCTLITALLPLYIQETMHSRLKRFADSAAIVSGVVSLMLLFLFYDRRWLLSVVIGLMSVSIVYSMTLLILNRKRYTGPVHRINLGLSIAVIVLIVLMIFFDFLFPLTEGFFFMPLIYLVVNILMLLPELPLISGRQEKGPRTDRFVDWNLTPREQEVACLLIRGKTYREIADELCISLQTVKTHANRIYAKSGTKSKMELLDRLR